MSDEGLRLYQRRRHPWRLTGVWAAIAVAVDFVVVLALMAFN